MKKIEVVLSFGGGVASLSGVYLLLFSDSFLKKAGVQDLIPVEALPYLLVAHRLLGATYLLGGLLRIIVALGGSIKVQCGVAIVGIMYSVCEYFLLTVSLEGWCSARFDHQLHRGECTLFLLMFTKLHVFVAAFNILGLIYGVGSAIAEVRKEDQLRQEYLRRAVQKGASTQTEEEKNDARKKAIIQKFMNDRVKRQQERAKQK